MIFPYSGSSSAFCLKQTAEDGQAHKILGLTLPNPPLLKVYLIDGKTASTKSPEKSGGTIRFGKSIGYRSG